MYGLGGERAQDRYAEAKMEAVTRKRSARIALSVTIRTHTIAIYSAHPAGTETWLLAFARPQAQAASGFCL